MFTRNQINSFLMCAESEQNDKMRKIALFDFDGTIVRVDSTRHLYKSLFKFRIAFYVNYYLYHLKPFMKAALSGDHFMLKESRRKFLSSRVNIDDLNEFLVLLRNETFDAVFNRMLYLKSLGREIYIVSAGYKEIIEAYLTPDLQPCVIARSIYDVQLSEINFDAKVEEILKRLSAKDVIDEAYGNSKGDVPMLKLAEKAYWVDRSGVISEFKI